MPPRSTPRRPHGPARQTLVSAVLAAGCLAGGLTMATSAHAELNSHVTHPSGEPTAPVAAPREGGPGSGAQYLYTNTVGRLGTSLRGLWGRVQPLIPWRQEWGTPMSVNANPSSLTPASLRGLQLDANSDTEGSFQARAGLVHSEAGNWWLTRSERHGSLSDCYRRLLASGVLSSATAPVSASPDSQAHPYLGASFSSRLNPDSPTPSSSWQLNADLGVMSLNTTNNARVSQVFNGDRSLDDLVRDMRFRPNVKVSLGYSF